MNLRKNKDDSGSIGGVRRIYEKRGKWYNYILTLRN